MPDHPSPFVEAVVRAAFFLLNLLANAIMWGLFTRALTAHSSATRVSLVNTSANFLITAILGMMLFAETLPPLWLAGAALLVVGNVVVGKDRGDGADKPQNNQESRLAADRNPTQEAVGKPKKPTEQSREGSGSEEVSLLGAIDAEDEDAVELIDTQ